MRHIEVHREHKGVVSEHLVFMSKKSKDGKVVTHYYFDENLNVNTLVVSADEYEITHLEEEQC